MKAAPGALVQEAGQRSAGTAFPPGTKSGRKIVFETLGDPNMIDRKQSIVAGLLGVGEIMVLHAEPKVGKTQLASWLSFCIATGTKFFDRSVKRGAVLYMALEKGPVTRKRFRALQRLHGGVQPPIALSTTPINLRSSVDAHAIIAAVNELAALHAPVSLIVFDTLNRAMPGVDENSAGQVGEAFNALTFIAEQTKAAILLLHHNVKGTSGKLRGSSVITASVDVVVALDKLDGDLREAEVTSANDAAEGQTFRFLMPTVEIAPAGPGHEADTTIVIEPMTEENGFEPGAARTRAPAVVSVAKADRDRAAKVLQLIRTIASDGRCSRSVLLSEARDQEIVSPLNPKSSAEQLRKALLLLSSEGNLSYTDHDVDLAA